MKKLLFVILSLYGVAAQATTNADNADACVSHGGTVLKSYASLSGIQGLANTFCVLENADSIAMVDLQTLGSQRPSIAATYLLKGVDVDALPPTTGQNPGTAYCKALEGSSITRYTSGGFVNPKGEDEVCVFGDGSMASIWAILYVSSNPGYLGIRAAIQSVPLPFGLPYLAQ
jgi:hypothetical protein